MTMYESQVMEWRYDVENKNKLVEELKKQLFKNVSTLPLENYLIKIYYITNYICNTFFYKLLFPVILFIRNFTLLQF